MLEASRNSDLIILEGLKFFSHIGYFDFEQENGQNFYLDIVLELGRPLAMANDELEDSVNYGVVYELVKQFMEAARHRLLEAAVEDLAALIFDRFVLVNGLQIRLMKPEAPIDGIFENMAVEISRRRWNQVGIALGTNCEPRQDYLEQAVARIFGSSDFQKQALSLIYESRAWGVVEQPDFLNAVMLAETRLLPHELLAYLKSIEEELGREHRGRWAQREIDLDILFYNDLELRTTELELPHPRMEERHFVMVPLRELTAGIYLDAETLELLELKRYGAFENLHKFYRASEERKLGADLEA